MALIVQKFGGTSLRTPESRKAVLRHIIRAKRAGNDVVVVVSAMGKNGDPYATDTLIGLLEPYSGEICLRNRDLLISCGEIISASVMASYIQSNGFDAEAMTGFQAGIITDDDFGSAQILRIDTSPVMDRIKNGKIAVIAGFQGVTESGEITTLGRGGSDITALALGGYLKADVVEIYTDVPGIAICDPHIIPEAPVLSHISYSEVLALAENGAKVLNPRAVKTAMEFKIPFRVRSTFGEDTGTLVGHKHHDFPISGISVQCNLAFVVFNREVCFQLEELKFMSSKLGEFVDMPANKSKALLIPEEKIPLASRVAKSLNAQVKIIKGLGKVCAVYNERDIALNREGTIAQQIEVILKDMKVPINTIKRFSNHFFAVIPQEFCPQAAKAVFDEFFIKNKRQAI
ncbi:MAG TPA: aspartate kinase [Thermoanaerobacterales bacterium]|nr:aspartate kinase [Thermoanaerobacterales bacterium]